MPVKKTDEIYTFIKEYVERFGYSPSIREICEGVRLKSPSTVHMYVKRLADEGRISYYPGKNRSITLNYKSNIKQIPVLGKVAAGIPILAVSESDDYIYYETTKDDVYALVISGDSMKDAGILDRDVVIVQKASTCNDGEIAVALVEDSATVKRFYKKNNKFHLVPENELYEELVLDEVDIIGKVIGLVRKI